MADRRGEVRQDIVQARIKMANVAGSMIAQEIIEFGECGRKILIAAAINNINPLGGVGVVKQQAMLLVIRRG